jgi:predicted methyltransferase MtxX (methanogen marker protein 4)
VYVKVQDAEEKTLGGVLLPESAQQRPTSGQVVSVGDGSLGNGKQMDFTVKAGDEVRAVVNVLGTPAYHTVALWREAAKESNKEGLAQGMHGPY